MLIQAECRRILFAEAEISANAAVVAGVSGGVDSMTLLHILSSAGLRVHVVHVNYHKRGDSSNADEQLVRKVCADAQINLEVVHWDPKMQALGNFQDQARQFRRDQYQRVMHETGCEAIILGHNQNDVYETLIMRVLRGAAPSNWNALPAVEIPYIRPLVTTSREQIERYAHDNGIVWREDESNKTSIYARNFLRHELLPEIDRLYPGWKTNVDRIKMYGDVYRLSLDQLLEPFGDGSKIPVDWLRSLDATLSKAIIHRIHERKGLPIRQTLPETVLALIDSQPGKMVELDDLVAWHRDYAHVVLDMKQHVGIDTFQFTATDINERAIDFEYGNIALFSDLDEGIGFAICEKPGTYTMRQAEAGDKLRTEGGSKAVSDLMNEWGVPRRLKPRACVLTLDGSVAAVIFKHHGFDTRWRIDPSHACNNGKCIHFLIHH
jgi:tRNA(Ile)-lysidine synthetase-like protein